MTLLQIVQDILSSMDSDEVNSISDTVESLQVANEVKNTYYEMLDGLEMPSFERLIQLESIVDVTRPTHLVLPETVKEIKWFKYDYQTNGLLAYTDVNYLSPQDFIILSMNKANQTNTLEVTDFEGPKFLVSTDQNPQWWTTFDNNHLIADAYNSSVDTTLQQSKNMAWAEVTPTFSLTDDFIPDLDTNLFSMLLAEATESCFVNFKQVSNAVQSQRARRQRMRFQNDRWRLDQRKPYEVQHVAGRNRPV